MSGVTALGTTWPEILAGFRARKNVIRHMTDWERFQDMGTKLAGPVENFEPPANWTRKQLRGMGRVSQLAVRAAEMALEKAGLLGDPLLKSGRVGVACGSCIGSTPDIKDFAVMLLSGSSEDLSANSYIKMMPHTAAANIGIFFGADHSHLERVHVGQPGYRVRLRIHQARAGDRDDRRRRRRAVSERGDGVRHAICHEPQERIAHRHAASLRPGSRWTRRRRRLGRAHSRRA
jgi:3-oxoacyl-[acyl-carrier-protein] synthase II